MKKKKFFSMNILAITYLLFTLLNGIIWGSTVSIYNEICTYYNVDKTSPAESLINSSYYLLYCAGSIICFLFNQYHKPFLIYIVITLLAFMVRLFAAASINSLIIGNILFACASAFITSFINDFTIRVISQDYQNMYFGLVTSISNLGYAIGYIVSLYLIDTDETYANYFLMTNYIYLCLFASAAAMYLITNKKNLFGYDMTLSIDSFSVTEEKIHFLILPILIVCYSLMTGIFNALSNNMETILTSKNLFTSQQIFLLSMITLLIGILFPIFFAERYSKTLFMTLLCLSGLAWIIFMYSTEFYSNYIALLICGLLYEQMVLILIVIKNESPNINFHTNMLYNVQSLISGILIETHYYDYNIYTILLIFSFIGILIVCKKFL